MRLQVISFAVLFLGIACQEKRPASEGSPKVWFPFDVGNRWVLEDRFGPLEFKVTASTQIGGIDCFEVSQSTDGSVFAKDFLQPRTDGVYLLGREIHNGDKFVYRHPACILKYPLSPGAKWKSIIDTGDGELQTLAYEVVSFEPQETPKGILDCVKIKRNDGITISFVWYALEIGQIREDTYALPENGNTFVGSLKLKDFNLEVKELTPQ